MIVSGLRAGLVGAALVFSAPAVAQVIGGDDIVVIGNDRGGKVKARLIELNDLQRRARSVRILGDFCYSTCTMYLGLPQTCVSRDTVFGFHGPTRRGRPLDPALFDYASRVIAHHYPATIKRWYLDTGRHEIRGLYKMKGAELIRHGIKECPEAG